MYLKSSLFTSSRKKSLYIHTKYLNLRFLGILSRNSFKNVLLINNCIQDQSIFTKWILQKQKDKYNPWRHIHIHTILIIPRLAANQSAPSYKMSGKRFSPGPLTQKPSSDAFRREIPDRNYNNYLLDWTSLIGGINVLNFNEKWKYDFRTSEFRNWFSDTIFGIEF